MALTQQQLQQLIVLRQTPAYSGLSQQAAATLASTPVYTPVPYATFQPAVMKLDAWGSVRLANLNIASYASNPALQAAILTAIDLFTAYAGDTVDLTAQKLQTALGLLEQNGIVAQADAAAILALGQSQPIPGAATVALADVQAADAAIALQQQAAQQAQKASTAYGAVVASINAAVNAGTAIPTNAACNQTFASAMGS